MKPFLKSYISFFELVTFPLFVAFVCIGFYQLAWFSFGILLSGLALSIGYLFAGAYLFAYPDRKRFMFYPVLCGICYGLIVIAILQCAIQSGAGRYLAMGAGLLLGLLWLSFLYHWYRGQMNRYYLRLHVIRTVILTLLLACTSLN